MEYIKETLRSAYNQITLSSINKVCCKLMIQRYLGVWLDKKLSVDQLSVQLANGCLSLKELNLNTTAVNGRLSECGIPLIIMDGYIGNIRVEVPWFSLLSESASICIEDFQLVIRGTETMDVNNVESVVSLIGSLLTGPDGVDMAKSVYEEISKGNNFASVFLSKDNTADSLLGFIDAIQSKFRFSIKNLTLRFEHVSSEEATMATAVELHIQNVSFEDLDNSTTSTFNLNKKFKVNGVSMYTDVFSNFKTHEATLRKTEMHNSDMFYSCYENWDQLETTLPDFKLSSAPIKCAEMLGDFSIIVRTKNESKNTNDANVNRSQIEIDTGIEALNIFATASQLEIIKRCFCTLSSAKVVKRTEDGKPMNEEGYEIILKMLEKKNTKRISLLEDSQCDDSVFSEYKNTRADENAKKDFRVGVKIGKFVVCIPHCDYLASSYAAQNGGFAKALDNLRMESDRFFTSLRNCKVPSKCGILEFQDEFYTKDHLRMSGKSIKTTSKFGNTDELLCEIITVQLNILEYLSPENVFGQSIPLKVNIFEFSEKEITMNKPNFKMVVKAALDKGNAHVDVLLGSVKTDVDLSIVDRLSNLIICKPFFDTSSNESSGANEFVEVPLQITDIGADVKGKQQPEILINVKCSKWEVDLRVPKIVSKNDFSHTRRNVHDEFFHFGFKQVDISIPIKKQVSVIDILCTELYGEFCGKESRIAKEQQRIFHAAKNGSTRINLKVVVKKNETFIDGKVQHSQSSGITQIINSSGSDDFLNLKREGPFSNTSRSYCTGEETKEIVQAGSRKEILEFHGKCELLASTLLQINVPTLKFHIPVKDSLELLYNIVVNDLASFKPSASVFVMPSNPTLAHFETSGSSELENANYFNRNAQHGFVMTLDAEKVAVVCNTTEASRVALDLERVHIGTTAGYHGDQDHTYFHFTSTKIEAGSSDSTGNSRISNVISSKNFGRWSKECSELETVSSTDELSAGSTDDAISIALHMHFEPATNVRDVIVGTAVRNIQLLAKPIRNFDEFWISRLTELFSLQDFTVPDYELPAISTDVHLCVDNVIIAYDHCWVNSESKVKLRAVLGNSFVTTSIRPNVEVLEALCVLQDCQLLLKDEKVKGSDQMERYNEAKVCSRKFVNIAALGSVQLDVLFGLEEKTNSLPKFEIRCQNDVLSAWACADSLATLTNTIIEYIEHVGVISRMEPGENVDTKSNVEESTWSYASTRSRRTQKTAAASELPDDVQRRLEAMIEEAVNYTDTSDNTVECEQIPETKLNTMKKMAASHELGEAVTDEFEITDDDFCFVQHSHLKRTNAIIPVESSVREFAVQVSSDNSLKTNFFDCINETDDDAKTDMETLAPILKYFLKDITIRLCLYSGNDLSDTASPFKSYSMKEFQNGCGPSQKLEANSAGGPHRDHSAFIVLELNKVTFEREVFDKEAPHSSTTVFKIDDIVIKDCVKTSIINEMLYQYSVLHEPRRSGTPLICVRVSENHASGGNMRVSMLPIKVNVDQDTFDFVSDFIEETFRLLDLKMNNNTQILTQLPTISVPSSKSAGIIAKETSPIHRDNHEVLVRASMTESVYPNRKEEHLLDGEGQLEDYGNFLNNLDDEEEPGNADETSGEIISDSQTFFQQFVFSPSIKIYVDYHGKRKMTKGKTGSLIGILMAFGQLNRMPITLQKINTRIGLLGFESCLRHAVNEWTKDMLKHIPSYIESIGPIRPLIQVGKGVRDLCQMPLSELNKNNGCVLKGLQKGVGKFGLSSAAGVIGMAQTLTGCVQSLAEMALQENKPDAKSKTKSTEYNGYNETIPSDVQHSLQLAYRLLHDKYHGTATDQQPTISKKRAVQKSMTQNAFEYAVPAILGPIALASQVTNQILGGMKNQLLPDSYQDKNRKYGGKKVPGREYK